MEKILIIGKYYHPYKGGIEENTRQVCEALLKEGHEVTALVNNHVPGMSVEIVGGVRVVRKKVQITLWRQPLSFSLLSGVKVSDYTIIHMHSPNPFAAMLLALKYILSIKQPRLVITHHMDIFGRRILRKLSMVPFIYLMKKADTILVTSLKNAKISKDLRHIVESDKIKAIPLGISLDDFRVSEMDIADAKKWRTGLVGRANTIGFVGRIARYKGLEILLKALTLIPDTAVLIGGDGEFLESLKNMAREYGVEDRVHFFGSITHAEKIRLLLASDLYAFPSTEVTEAFGISQLEAMALNVPVVATELGTGVNDVSVDGKTALLAKPGDAADLAEKLLTILTDSGRAEMLAVTARKRLEAMFTDQRVSDLTVRAICRQ